MYTLTRILPLHTLLLKQLPALGGALIVAEVFYKFHSFVPVQPERESERSALV